MQMEKVLIYTDGSSRGNPGPGGWGAIVATLEKVVEMGGREEHTTNNRMELMACIKSLESVEGEIVLYTDSQYVKNGITSWIHGWQKNGWRNAAKKPVANQDLWQELLKVGEGKSIEWKFVKGHAENPGNNRCDVIATSFADNEPVELYTGEAKDYQIKIRI